MKHLIKPLSKLNKGASSGVLVSLAFHAALFFIAALFVVFQVMSPPEPEFEAPPQIERPKMNLKKPKVKVKKSSQPKPSSRIVAKVKTREMPEIQLPDLEGAGEGLLGGVGTGGDVLDLPTIGEMTLFGMEESIGNDFIGTFYDFKRLRGGGELGVSDPLYEMPMLFAKFLSSGWDKSVFAKYYQAPKKLYASAIVIGECPSIIAPLAFGVDTPGYYWGVLYEGTLVSYKDIRFRFWGMGDNYLFVGINGETVLGYWLGVTAGSTDDGILSEYTTRTEFGTPMSYAYGFNGKWIDLKAGEPMDMKVLIGESAGGVSGFMLCVEVEGEEYPRNPYLGGKTLPIFQTAVQSLTQVENLQRVIYPGDASVNQGPIFQDFEPQMLVKDGHVESGSAMVAEAEPEYEMREWNLLNGLTVKGELFSLMSEKAWIRREDGSEIKIPFDQFAPEDRVYLDLCNPPELEIDFTYTSEQAPLPEMAFIINSAPVEIIDYKFGARVKVRRNRQYHYPLTVEYFAIGKEIESDNYILFQRVRETFRPSKENNYSLEFYGDPIRRINFAAHQSSKFRGEEYRTYLITVTDQRGKIIQHRTPNAFLYENLDKLKQLPVTRHFDKNCDRVAPSRPKNDYRSWSPVFDWAD